MIINEEQREISQIIIGQSKVAIELLEELLDIHKMERGQYQLELRPVEPARLIKKALAEQKLPLEKIRAKVALSSDLPEGFKVPLDAFQIRMVFRNFLSNAVKHMPPEGNLTIRLFAVGRNEIEITFQNDGPQIPEERMQVIFDKFVQVL